MPRARAVLSSLAAGALLLVPIQAGAEPPPIPPLPTDLLSESFTGTPATAQPIAHPAIPDHPSMSPTGTNSMHNDAYASDAYTVSGPLGRDLQVRSASYGISECATIAFDASNRIVGLCGGVQGFTMRLIDPTTLDQIASLDMPARDLTSGANPLSDLCGGTYFYLDKHNRAYVLTTGNQMWEVTVGASSLSHTRTFSPTIPEGDCMIATMPDWQGRIFFATKGGRVGTIDPGTGATRLRAFPGEAIFNSLAADETGAVYVVTDHRLLALEADATGMPQVRWAAAYDRGTKQKPGQLSQGSGTTPTLIGKDLVVITDNAEPRMNVLFFKRDGDRRNRLICKAPVFAAGASATENSLVAAGRSVLVENNYGYEGPQSTMGGRTTAPGVARVVLDRSGCRVAWTSEVTAPTSVPKASLGNGLVYVYSKPASTPLDDSWYFTALDIRTGATRWLQRTGNGTQWNNHYASIYLGPDGAAYMPTMTGLVRSEDGEQR
jgi:hypothetical protein